MDLNYTFNINASREETWAALLDMPRVANCLPGAEVTEVIDERNCKGLVKIKLGPVSLGFNGKASFTDVDHAAHRAVMDAAGTDKKGRGSGQAKIDFGVTEPLPGTTHVAMDVDMTLSGTIAQYGRASGLIDQVAQQLIAEFVNNLEVQLSESQGVSETFAVAEVDTGTMTETPFDIAGPDDTETENEVQTRTSTAPSNQVANSSGSDNAVSGFSLLFGALQRMLASKFGAGKNRGGDS